MYILLHGAKRNVGDFLIFERAKELITAYRKVNDFVVLPRWLSLEPHLDTINKSEGVILCGGPGYAENFYPFVFPLVTDLSRIKVPIIPLGLGWGVGNTVTKAEEFQFSQKSLSAIKEIHSRIRFSSVRDVLTEQVIKNAGIKNVVTTGCPAWYYLPYVDRDFEPPKRIKKIVVSTPAQQHNFIQAHNLILLISKLFPKAEKYVVFHRGILPGKYAGKRDVFLNGALAAASFLTGCKVIDASYSTQKIEFYKECDLHIGYRVHAHIDFLSLRKPSILLQEDARGVGQSKTLQTEDMDVNHPDFWNTLENLLTEHRDTRFDSFHKTITIMKSKFHIMKQFIESF